jgi:hypothetical protein
LESSYAVLFKIIDCWKIVETSWTKPADATPESVNDKNLRFLNDKDLHALCQALSLSEFSRISNSESAKEAWKILETTYEGTKLVKSTKLQILISRFEEIKMLEEETLSFGLHGPKEKNTPTPLSLTSNGHGEQILSPCAYNPSPLLHTFKHEIVFYPLESMLI